MKRLLLLIFLAATFGLKAQNNFGENIDTDGALAAKEIINALADQSSMQTKVEGTVQEVCQMKGCWMTMDLGNEQSMRITFKDYGFFVPKNASGRKAVIQGELKKEITPVATLRHYAKDAGKSQAEIDAITEPQTELVFVAEGVLFLN